MEATTQSLSSKIKTTSIYLAQLKLSAMNGIVRTSPLILIGDQFLPLPGQTLAPAPAIMGDWVIGLTNGGAPTNVSLSVVSISHADPNQIVRINPIPLEHGGDQWIRERLVSSHLLVHLTSES